MHESDDDATWRFFKKAVVLSLAVHAVAIVVIAFSTIKEKHSISLAPINMIELAEPGQTMRQKPARPAPRKAEPPPAPAPAPKVEKAAPKVAVKPPPELPPRIAKKVEETPPLAPTPKAVEKPKPPPPPEMTEAELRERMKKLKEKVGDKMEGLGEKRRSEADVRASIEEMQKRHAAAPQPETPKVAPKPEVAGPVALGAGVAKGTIVDMRFTAYRTRLWEHVKARWSLLPSLAGRGLATVVVANVTRSGAVTKAWVETSSGVDAFDQSALRAVLTSSPLPEIPSDIPESAFAEGLGFRFTE